MTTPSRDQTGDDEPAPTISNAALQLWVLALLMTEFMLTCWWFGRMYSS